MKRVLLLITCSTLLLTSCGGNSSKDVIVFEKPEGYVEVIDNSVDPSIIQQTAAPVNKANAAQSSQVKLGDTMLGRWIGEMSGKKLTIVIEKVEGNQLFGYNQLGNNNRALKGTFVDGDWAESCSKAYKTTLAEPGDDKWDGVFTITFVGYTDVDDETGDCIGNDYRGVEAMGSWKSNNGKLTREFSLEKVGK